MCKCKDKCRCNITSITKGAKGDTGATGATGPTGPPGPNGWLLNGNTEGAEKYFGTNDNFDIPIYTNGVVRGVFDKSGNFGFGITSALTARVHVKGVDATFANFGLKIDNSASSPLLYVRNDKFVGIGVSTPTTSGAMFQVSQTSYDEVARFEGFFGGTFNAFVIDKNGNTISYQYSNVKEGFVLGSASFLSHFITAPNDWVLELGNTTLKNDSVNSKTVYQSGYNKLAFRNAGGSQMALLTGTSDIMLFGVGLNLTPTATIHALGSDATSSNFSLKVDNSSSSPLLYVRNDGNVGIGISSPTAKLYVKSPDATIGNYGIIWANGTGTRGWSIDNDGSVLLSGRQTIVWANGASFTAFDVYAQTSQILNIQGGGTGTVCVGAGVASTDTRLHVKGVDSTSANYALKVDNSSSSPLLYVRNDGVVLINSSTAYSGVGTGTPIGFQSQSIEAYLFGNNSNRTYGEIRWGSGQRHTQTYLENAATAGFIEYFNSRVDFNFDVARFLSKGGTEYMRLTSDGVSINFASPQAEFHVFGVNSNNINLRLEPVSNVTEDTRGGTVNTTDATANVTAMSIPVAVGKVLSLESTIVYRKTGGAGVGTTGDGTTIKLNSSVKNVGGTLTLDTVQNTYAGTINSIAGVSATYTISGTNVLVSVTGVLNDNITWNVITKVNTVA